MPVLTIYTEVGLNQLIFNQVEENLHLEYKSGFAVVSTDKCRIEITKDVSAFANSDGVL